MERIVDLTHEIETSMPIYPGDPSVEIKSWNTHEKNGCQISKILMGSHTGTHVDAPWHFNPQGASLDNLSLSRFVGKGTLIDVSNKGTNEKIDTKDIAAYRSYISSGEFVVFMTGWDRHYRERMYFKHPFLTETAAKMLVDMGVSLVGIDTLSVDSTMDKTFSVHSVLMNAEILIVENLCNLKEVPFVKGMYSFLPLKVKKGDGSPVRAIFFDSPVD
ncbi:cyclase family protein [Tindallia californiensis]|uniref:Kynurenine formamidase n=1 Tax=Tindallia californiensis TaxID=159292 RepID=A0A1H3IL75_9FIRM|nr:cyclase family protein [Tindallia californiensis]SDY28115.1 Kynurenine formamidase [Tindallia californiensis]